MVTKKDVEHALGNYLLSHIAYDTALPKSITTHHNNYEPKQVD